MIKILDPTVAAAPADAPLAKREHGLDGKVLGLLENSKVNGDRLLALVRAELGARYDLRDVVVMTKAGASTTKDSPGLKLPRHAIVSASVTTIASAVRP